MDIGSGGASIASTTFPVSLPLRTGWLGPLGATVFMLNTLRKVLREPHTDNGITEIGKSSSLGVRSDREKLRQGTLLFMIVECARAREYAKMDGSGDVSRQPRMIKRPNGFLLEIRYCTTLSDLTALGDRTEGTGWFISGIEFSQGTGSSATRGLWLCDATKRTQRTSNPEAVVMLQPA
ncbi:hypothetical protein CBL_07282 [Carabus blaptoides fortunei]